jgi:hypothetical protein
VGVIGRAFIEGGATATPSIEEFDRIIAGAKQFTESEFNSIGILDQFGSCAAASAVAEGMTK